MAFQPLSDRKIPDIDGEVWRDAGTGAPLELEYTYTGLNRILGRYEVPRIIADIRDRATSDLPGGSDRMTHRLKRAYVGRRPF